MMAGWTGEAMSSAAAIIAAFWAMRHADQKDRKAAAESEKAERERVIKAITDRDKRLMYMLQENVPHSHLERGDECLKADGIKYTRIRLNGDE